MIMFAIAPSTSSSMHHFHQQPFDLDCGFADHPYSKDLSTNDLEIEQEIKMKETALDSPTESDDSGFFDFETSPEIPPEYLEMTRHIAARLSEMFDEFDREFMACANLPPPPPPTWIDRLLSWLF